jgi:hypothetical protein
VSALCQCVITFLHGHLRWGLGTHLFSPPVMFFRARFYFPNPKTAAARPSCQFANSIEPRLELAKGHRRFYGGGAPRPALGRGIPCPCPPPRRKRGGASGSRGSVAANCKKAKSHVSSPILSQADATVYPGFQHSDWLGNQPFAFLFRPVVCQRQRLMLPAWLRLCGE